LEKIIFKHLDNYLLRYNTLMTMPDSSQGASGGTSGRSGSESKLDTDVR
jgi:hypothetical protein